MNRRPMVFGVLLFVSGTLLINQSWYYAGAGILAVFGGAFFYFSKYVKKPAKTAGLLAFFCALILGLGALNGMRSKDKDVLFQTLKEDETVGENVSFYANIVKMETKEETLQITVRPQTVTCDGTMYEKTKKILIYMDDSDEVKESDYKIGDTISVWGELYLPDTATNPGQFDTRAYYQNKGIYYCCNAYTCKVIKSDSSILGIVKNRIFCYRLETEAFIKDNLNEPESSLLGGILLGDSKGIDSDAKTLFQRNGIAHILAISALHIAIVGGAIYKLLRRLRMNLYAAFFLVFALLMTYGYMTGFSGSTIRAVIMFLLLVAGDVLGRTYDMLTAIAIACVLMLVSEPNRIYDSTFWLSFSCVIILGTVIPCIQDILNTQFEEKQEQKKEKRISKKKSRKRMLLESIVISFFFQIFEAPVTIYFFYDYPTYSLILNFLIIPCMTPLVLCGMLAVILWPLSEKMALCLLLPCKWILRLFLMLCNVMEHLPLQILHFGHLRIYQILIYYGTLLVLLVCFQRFRKTNTRKTILIFLISIPALILTEYLCSNHSLTVQMLDIGQGDSILVKSKNRETYLIDCGSSTKSNIGKYIVCPALKYYGCGTIDYIFVSHMDSDHMNGVKELITNEEDYHIKIGHLMLPVIAKNDEEWETLTELADEKDIPVLYLNPGDTLTEQNLSIECLYPMEDVEISEDDKNNNSMVLLLQNNNFKMLFTGDIEEEAEENMLADSFVRSNLENITVLKVAHHGSRSSSSADFLMCCNPELALISAGKDNSYGHPHAETLKKLEENNIAYRRTDESGSIRLLIKNKIESKNLIWYD